MTNHLSCTLSVLLGHYWLRSSFVIDRSLGTYGDPATLHRCPPLGLVAWRRNGHTVSAVPRTLYASVYPSNHRRGGGAIPQYFPIRPSSLTFIPCLVPLLLYFTKKQPFIGLTRHLIGQFLHHVISGNIKRRPWFMNYYNNTINCLT